MSSQNFSELPLVIRSFSCLSNLEGTFSIACPLTALNPCLDLFIYLVFVKFSFVDSY